MKTVGFILGGALVGLVYQQLVGCGTRACMITSSPYAASLYGAAVGFVVGRR